MEYDSEIDEVDAGLAPDFELDGGRTAPTTRSRRFSTISLLPASPKGLRQHTHDSAGCAPALSSVYAGVSHVCPRVVKSHTPLRQSKQPDDTKKTRHTRVPQ